LSAACVKLFSTRADTCDQIARATGAFAETRAGIRNLVAAGVLVELWAPLSRENLDHYARYAEVARELGVYRVRTEAPLDGLGLALLEPALEALGELVAACRAHGVSLDARPLAAGWGGLLRVPEPQRAPR
jgi:hypothetical protein